MLFIYYTSKDKTLKKKMLGKTFLSHYVTCCHSKHHQLQKNNVDKCSINSIVVSHLI